MILKDVFNSFKDVDIQLIAKVAGHLNILILTCD
jgi:hypothetical protein